MEAALAELGLEDLTKEAEDDKDFFVEKGEAFPSRNSAQQCADDIALLFVDEEDIFGSDFESTDEETAQADVDAGDKAVDEEEKRARKVRLNAIYVLIEVLIPFYFIWSPDSQNEAGENDSSRTCT
jgi:vacuolar protein sorting-associated protein 72